MMSGYLYENELHPIQNYKTARTNGGIYGDLGDIQIYGVKANDYHPIEGNPLPSVVIKTREHSIHMFLDIEIKRPASVHPPSQSV